MDQSGASSREYNRCVVALSPFWHLALILAVVATVSLPALDIDLWGDDFTNLDSAYRISDQPIDALGSMFVFFRPTMLLSMYVSYRCFDQSVLLYNLSTLAHHLFVVTLFFALFRRLRQGWVATAIATLAFGTTPLAVEATSWSGARADVLLAATALALLILLTRNATNHAWTVRIGLIALFVLAACTKESWMILPPLAASFLVLIRGAKIRDSLRLTASGWILLILYILFFFVRPLLSGTASALNYGGSTLDPIRLFSKFGALFWYYMTLGQIPLAPILEATAGWTAFLALVAAAGWQRNRLSLFGALFLILALVPTIHFAVSPSRFNYIPLLGFFLCLIPLLEPLFNPAKGRFSFLAVVSAALLLLLLQARLVHREYDDYRSFARRHRTLVDSMNSVVNQLQDKEFILLTDFGRINAPVEFQRQAEGLPKNIYPKPGGLWNIIAMRHLANFCGSPFQQRLTEIPAAQVSDAKLATAFPVVFRDTGFSFCNRCSAEVLAWRQHNPGLPARVHLYTWAKVDN